MSESDPKKSGARVVSVFGPFASKALVEMSTDKALELFDCPLPEASPMHVIDGVLADIAAVAERDEALAGGALASTALQLAYELANPYNSATSKAMCAKALIETLERLEDQAPPKAEETELDHARKRRAARLAGLAASEAAPPS